MLNENFEKALVKVSETMATLGAKWAVIGSANMAVQGIDIEPKDLDIVVLKNDLEKIQDAFSEFIISGIKKLDLLYNRDAQEVLLDIGGIEVQLLGEPENGLYADKLATGDLAHIAIGNRDIPCRPLVAEAGTYEKTGRTEKAEIIREYLKSA